MKNVETLLIQSIVKDIANGTFQKDFEDFISSLNNIKVQEHSQFVNDCASTILNLYYRDF